MNPSAPYVQHYRRTDMDRLGEWQPMDSTWKTAASAGLVGHDIYHHLPGDRGMFAEEVAAFGAEWYVEIQPIGKSFESVRKSTLERFERTVADTVLNALDSPEKRPFDLPLRSVSQLSDAEITYFKSLANKAAGILNKSEDPRAMVSDSFADRFVQLILWGYEQASIRFPDQQSVRDGCAELTATLNYLDQDEVPYGHEVKIELSGYACSVTYDDADAFFIAEYKPVAARMMVWCSCTPGYPAKEITIHPDESAYGDFVAEHFFKQDDSTLSEEMRTIPLSESHALQLVYICDPALQKALLEAGSLKLPLNSLDPSKSTPRQVPVF